MFNSLGEEIKIKKIDLSLVIPMAPGLGFNPKESKVNVPYQVIEGLNTSANRNQGIKKAKSKFIGFINAHTILNEDWYDCVCEFFRRHPEIDIVGGPQLTGENESPFAKASGIALSSPFGAANVGSRYARGNLNLDTDERSVTSANLICKREVFEKVKFDENLYPGEDPKFIADAKRAGFKVAYTPDIVVYNKRRGNLKDLAKQIFNYGKVRPKLETFSSTLRKPFFLIPSLFVLYLVFLPLLYSQSELFAVPLYFYFFLNLAFSAFEGLRNKSLFVLINLPAIFVAIHLSYGVGFMIGLLKWSH